MLILIVYSRLSLNITQNVTHGHTITLLSEWEQTTLYAINLMEHKCCCWTLTMKHSLFKRIQTLQLKYEPFQRIDFAKNDHFKAVIGENLLYAVVAEFMQL